MAHANGLRCGMPRGLARLAEQWHLHVDLAVVVDALEHVRIQYVVGTEPEVAVVVADDHVQMPAVDAAQTVERVLDGAPVGQVAKDPQFVVASDDLVDVADDGALMPFDVADGLERRPIVVHVLFDPCVRGGAPLCLPDVMVFGAEPAVVQESAQCGDQRMSEMRVRSEITHVIPYAVRLAML